MFSHDQDAPDYRKVWDKVQRATKNYDCAFCKEVIETGTLYESHGYYLDGEFFHDRQHLWASRYPSGCPKYHERDRLDAEEAERAFNG